MTIIKTGKRILPVLFCFAFVCLISALGFYSDANAQDEATTDRLQEKSLSVITVGSGVPGPFANRAEAMTVIQHNGRYIVLDCGYTSVLKLLKDDFPLDKIDMLLFTHLHADHTTDFFNLMTWRALRGGRELEILGPPRTAELYDFFRKFYHDDMIYRLQVSNIDTTVGSLSGVKVREIVGSQIHEIDGIRIESAEMVHTMYDLAYKFTIDGKTIVVSGDTSYNKNLIKLAKNTDLLVLDGSFIIYALRTPDQKTADRPVPIGSGKRKVDGKIPIPSHAHAGNFGVESHLNYNDIIKTVSETRPKKLVLTHLFSAYNGRPDPLTKEVLDKVRSDLKKAGYEGEVHFAEDGLEVNL
jgi:ribonuclease BN (tRNA processing enzyme)